MQAGRLGIIRALLGYDPDRSKPTTYFGTWITHEMGLLITTIKSRSKPHLVTIKRKIQKVDKLFEKYGRKPMMCDHAYIIDCPFHCIMSALAEMRAGSVETSIDDPEVAPLADRRSPMRSPEETAMSNLNAGKILEILYEIEPRKEIVDCFIDQSLNGKQKASELAKKYGLTPSKVTEGCRSLADRVRCHPKIQKMYPEHFGEYQKEFFVTAYYQSVLTGQRKEFPRCFFSGGYGAEQNARICLMFALQRFAGCRDPKDCMKVMSSEQAVPFLKEAKLYAVMERIYKSPIAYVKDALFMNGMLDLDRTCVGFGKEP